MSRFINIVIIFVLIIFIFTNKVQANYIDIVSDVDLTTINPGDEFTVKISMNLEEDSAVVQGKIEFDNTKFEIKETNTEEGLAVTKNNEYIGIVTMDVDGNFIVNTVNGTKGNNEFEVYFKVKDDVKLKNERITLKFVDSNLKFDEQNDKYIEIGKQSNVFIYAFLIVIVVIIIFIIIVKLKRKG